MKYMPSIYGIASTGLTIAGAGLLLINPDLDLSELLKGKELFNAFVNTSGATEFMTGASLAATSLGIGSSLYFLKKQKFFQEDLKKQRTIRPKKDDMNINYQTYPNGISTIEGEIILVNNRARRENGLERNIETEYNKNRTLPLYTPQILFQEKRDKIHRTRNNLEFSLNQGNLIAHNSQGIIEKNPNNEKIEIRAEGQETYLVEIMKHIRKT